MFRVIRRRYALEIALLTVVVLLPGKALCAQAPSGALRGTVRAQQGSPIAGAAVAVRNLETGESKAASSNADGQFEILRLEPGSYEMEVSREGFVPHQEKNVRLSAGQSVTLELALESAGETSAQTAAQVNRISESQLVGLPLNGRSYTQLATLQAGVSSSSGEDASRGIGGGGLTVSGGRSVANNFLLDGTMIMNVGNQVPRSAAGVQLGSDTVYQVQVFSTQYGAEYGRTSGGILNSITRSGTNEFHGALFEYFRNSTLDARNFFDRDPQRPTRRSDPPPFKRNQFGFTATGPVRKETTFFMVGFEAMRDRLSTTDVSFYPDENAHRGYLPDERGNLEFVGVNPRVQKHLDLIPLPNGGSIGRGLGQNFAPQFLPTDENFFTLRVDHKISERDSLFGRYTFDDASSVSPSGSYVFRSLTESRQQYLTLVATHIFSLSAVNSFRFGYTRPVDASRSLASIPIPSDLLFSPEAPQYGIIDVPGMTRFGSNLTYPDGNNTNTFQFANDVVLQRGPHALKFGAEVHRYWWDIFSSAGRSGWWTFNGLRDFLEGGTSTTLQITLPDSDNHKAFRQTLAGFYVQDSYRATGRLQLNLGLRYEFATVFQDTQGRTAFLPDHVHDTEVQVGSLLQNNPSLLNFSPRLAFTWSPWNHRNTVLSGGFGIYYDQLLGYVTDVMKNTGPFYKRAVGVNLDTRATFPNAWEAAATIPFTVPYLLEVMDYTHVQSPTVLRYNFSLLQQLPQGWRVQASYVGNRGNHLMRGYEANLVPYPVQRPDGSLYFPPGEGPRNPAFGGITLNVTDAQSFYNSLQLSLAKSASRGFSIQANYTLSKSVDDASSYSGGTQTNSSRQYPHNRTSDRALSDFDIRQRLAINYFFTPPLGAGQRWWKSGILAQILGGWRLGGILNFRTGTPFHPLVNVTAPNYLFVANRPNLNPGQAGNLTSGVGGACLDPRTGATVVEAGRELGGPNLYFDPCAYSVPEPGTLGNVGRNTIIAPSVFNMDLSLQKEFLLGGERRLQFRAEFFNLPNHTNFAGVSGGSVIAFTGTYPGRPNPSAGRITRTATTARQVQFALRLSF
ncbi:MAG: TonB-dependent receptor [Acidobacteria bacterium]|nr:TonB-dependent receptor [Acidobacteriota bacterium]